MADFSKNYGREDKCVLCGKNVDSEDEVKNCKVVKEKFENINIIDNVYEGEVEPETANLIHAILHLRNEAREKS